VYFLGLYHEWRCIYPIYEIITVSNGSFIFFLHQINALNIHNLNITPENDPKAGRKNKLLVIVILTLGWIYLGFENGSISKMHKLMKAWYLYRNHFGREPNGATWELLCKGFQQQLPIHTTKFVVSTAHIAITRLA